MEVLREDVFKLLIALLLGGLIGAEREYHSKSAGFRTIILITLGSTIFTLLSYKLGDGSDAWRITANIITGIGFLGAGVIFKDENRVGGLTTATIIWVAAALGMCIGSGYFSLAFVTFTFIIIVLVGFKYAEIYIDKVNQIRKYKIVRIYKEKTLIEYEDVFKKYNLIPHRGKQSRINNEIIGYWDVQGSAKNHEQFTRKLLDDPDVKEFDF
jgi:putative Mg2+ transporter-C (MgtC) family protein